MRDIFNRNIRNIYNNFQSYTEIYKNIKVSKAYNEILKYEKQEKRTIFKNIILDGGFYNLGYFTDYNY